MSTSVGVAAGAGAGAGAGARTATASGDSEYVAAVMAGVQDAVRPKYPQDVKVFNDPVHGHIDVHPLLVRGWVCLIGWVRT